MLNGKLPALPAGPISAQIPDVRLYRLSASSSASELDRVTSVRQTSQEVDIIDLDVQVLVTD